MKKDFKHMPIVLKDRIKIPQVLPRGFLNVLYHLQLTTSQDIVTPMTIGV